MKKVLLIILSHAPFEIIHLHIWAFFSFFFFSFTASIYNSTSEFQFLIQSFICREKLEVDDSH